MVFHHGDGKLSEFISLNPQPTKWSFSLSHWGTACHTLMLGSLLFFPRTAKNFWEWTRKIFDLSSRFYPFHYAPYVSDIKDFQDHPFSFNIGQPFLPFEQLLAVLPAASKTLLPEPFRSLMIMDNSPIIDFYPPKFETDINGKRQDWEAVVLIPFIDEVSHLLYAAFLWKCLEKWQRKLHLKTNLKA